MREVEVAGGGVCGELVDGDIGLRGKRERQPQLQLKSSFRIILEWTRQKSIDDSPQSDMQPDHKTEGKKGWESGVKGSEVLTPAVTWYPEISVGAPGKISRTNPLGTGG